VPRHSHWPNPDTLSLFSSLVVAQGRVAHLSPSTDGPRRKEESASGSGGATTSKEEIVAAILGAVNMQAVSTGSLKLLVARGRVPTCLVSRHLLALKEQHEARIYALETEKDAIAKRKARLQSRLSDYKLAYDSTYRSQLSLQIWPHMLGSFRFDSETLTTSGFQWKAICALSSVAPAAPSASLLHTNRVSIARGGLKSSRSNPSYSLYMSVNDTAFAVAWKVKAKVLLEVVVTAGQGCPEVHVVQPRSFTHQFTSRDKERGVADMFDERALQKAVIGLQPPEISSALARAMASQYLVGEQPIRVTVRASIIVLEANGAAVPLCDQNWPTTGSSRLTRA